MIDEKNEDWMIVEQGETKAKYRELKNRKSENIKSDTPG